MLTLFLIKVKGEGLKIRYNAAYTSQTQDQQSFEVSERKWQLINPDRANGYSLTRGSRCSQQTHHRSTLHTIGLQPVVLYGR